MSLLCALAASMKGRMPSSTTASTTCGRSCRTTTASNCVRPGSVTHSARFYRTAARKLGRVGAARKYKQRIVTRPLIRDGRDVKVGSRCRIISGTWRSYYDGLTVKRARRVDIDHMVPLANAWRCGARRWTTARRRRFANDLENSQLIAVSASSNRSTGDQGPEAWKPPRGRAWCLYSRWWVQVKRYWRLTVRRAERTELWRMVATC